LEETLDLSFDRLLMMMMTEYTKMYLRGNGETELETTHAADWYQCE